MRLTVVDLRVTVLLAAAMAVLMSVILVYQWRSYRDVFRGMGLWSAAPALIFVGGTLYAFRDTMAFALLPPAGAGLIFTGLAAYATGTRQFLGETAPRWPWVMLVAAVAAMWVFTSISPSMVARAWILAIMICALAGETIAALWSHRRNTFTGGFLLIGLALVAVLMLVRAVMISLPGQHAGLAGLMITQMVYLAVYGLLLFWLTIGFVLLGEEGVRNHVEHLALHDRLTGALTRGALMDRGAAEAGLFLRQGRAFSVLMLDLDHFKQVNDRYGHLAGDQVLRAFADHVRATLRRHDAFGRYGGEEFVVILPVTGRDEALTVASRINARQDQEQHPRVTVSIGVASCEAPAAGKDPALLFEQLLRDADTALYAAKAAGRNRVLHHGQLDQRLQPAA